jgi:enoyl-CoA hydratase/carnithine racemase
MTEPQDISVQRIDDVKVPGVATIRFNRPEVKNALTPADMLQVARHLFDCQHDPNVKAVFLTGSGNAFCAGADLKALNAEARERRAQSLDAATELMTRIVSTPKIVVAAVNGVSAGLGNHIALCSDLCIAVRDATFHFTGAAKGIPSMQYGGLLLPMVIGLKRAKELLLRGGKVTAERAEQLGICNTVVAPEQWPSEVAALAADLATRDPATMAHNKFQANQIAFQLYGALKLSALAGGAHMAAADSFPPGRIDPA